MANFKKEYEDIPPRCPAPVPNWNFPKLRQEYLPRFKTVSPDYYCDLVVSEQFISLQKSNLSLGSHQKGVQDTVPRIDC
jgi:hypothetical protein